MGFSNLLTVLYALVYKSASYRSVPSNVVDSPKAKMTAIAAICRPGEIVIAADSRKLSPTDSAQTLACKIRDLNTLFAAVSGINTYAPTNFDVSQLLPTQMPNVDIGANLDSLCGSILPPLRLALEHLRNDNPDLFQRYALEKSPMGIKCARVQNFVPTLITLNVDV